MSLPLRPKNSWATPEDWNAHRELITALYWDERKTLKEVKEFMHLQHGFDATDKMYKARFKRWGLSKNLKNCDELQVVRHATTGKSVSLPVIRGRQIGSKRLRSRLYQMNANLSSSSSSSASASTSPSPLSGRLESPDICRFSEGSMVAVIHFATARMQSDCFGLSGPGYDWNGDTCLTMWQDIRLGAGAFSSRQPPKPNFPLLNKAFEWYPSVLDAGSPCLVWVSILAVLLLAQVGQELANVFTRHAAALSAIKLGPVHPLTRLWSMVKSMPIQQFREAAPAILEAYFSNIRSSIGAGEEVRRMSILHAARYLQSVGAMSLESATEVFQQVTEELRADTHGKFHVLWYWFARYFHCELLTGAGKYEEAYKAMAAVGLYVHRGSPDFTYNKLIGSMFDQSYYTMKANTLEALGRVDEATSYYIGAYMVIKRRQTKENSTFRLAMTSSDLRAHYHRQGDDVSAERVRVEAETYWDALVQQKLARHRA